MEAIDKKEIIDGDYKFELLQMVSRFRRKKDERKMEKIYEFTLKIYDKKGHSQIITLSYL